MLFVPRDHSSAAELHVLGSAWGAHDSPPVSEVEQG